MSPVFNLKIENFVGGSLWSALGIALCVGSAHIGLGTLGQPGPGSLAFLAGLLLTVLGVGLLIVGVYPSRHWQRSGAQEDVLPQLGWGALAVPIVGIFAYAYLLPVLGFALTSFLFLFGLFLWTKPKHWQEAMAASAASVGVSYLVFVILLKVRFPTGFLGLG